MMTMALQKDDNLVGKSAKHDKSYFFTNLTGMQLGQSTGIIIARRAVHYGLDLAISAQLCFLQPKRIQQPMNIVHQNCSASKHTSKRWYRCCRTQRLGMAALMLSPAGTHLGSCRWCDIGRLVPGYSQRFQTLYVLRM